MLSMEKDENGFQKFLNPLKACAKLFLMSLKTLSSTQT